FTNGALTCPVEDCGLYWASRSLFVLPVAVFLVKRTACRPQPPSWLSHGGGTVSLRTFTVKPLMSFHPACQRRRPQRPPPSGAEPTSAPSPPGFRCWVPSALERPPRGIS